MKLKDVIMSVNDLISDTENKKEMKMYNMFLSIFKSLENLDLTEEQFLLIENKIDELELLSKQDKKSRFLNKKLVELTRFLKDKLSLSQEDYYIGIGMSFGMVAGIAFASIFNYEFGMGNETTGGLITGMFIGMIIGAVMDKKAKEQNKTYKIK